MAGIMVQTDNEIKTFLGKVTGKNYNNLRRSGVSVDYEELYAEMACAYVHALNKFDVNRGDAQFQTFATVVCDHRVNRYVANLIRWHKQDQAVRGPVALDETRRTDGVFDADY